MIRSVLIMGNSPSVLEQRIGGGVDSFQGDIVRLNGFRIAGYELSIGTRTDVWFARPAVGITIDPSVSEVEEKIIVCDTFPEQTGALASENLGLSPEEYRIVIASELTGSVSVRDVSVGLLSILFYLREGAEVWIHGFDFYQDWKRHYYDDVDLDVGTHNWAWERSIVEEYVAEGKVNLYYNPYY